MTKKRIGMAEAMEMAKKSSEKKPVDVTAEVERSIRRAIEDVPSLRDLPEGAWLGHVTAALDLIQTGFKMRQEELAVE